MKSLSAAERGHAAMLAFSALVAGSFSFGSMIANKIDPVALMALRFSVAGVLIGAVAALGPGLRRVDFRAPWRYLLLGALFSGYFVLMFEGLKTAPPVSVTAVFTLTPVLSAGFGWLFLRQVTTPRMAAALAVGAAGALWVIFRGDPGAALRFELGRGEAIYFVGCIFHAAYTPLLKRLNRGEPAVSFNFAVIVAMVLLLTLYGREDIAAADWAALSPADWLIVLYLAVSASAVTFMLLRYSSQHLPAAKVMAYTYLTPSWVIGWEAVLGNGVPAALTLAGVLLTVAALWMLLRDEAAPRPARGWSADAIRPVRVQEISRTRRD